MRKNGELTSCFDQRYASFASKVDFPDPATPLTITLDVGSFAAVLRVTRSSIRSRGIPEDSSLSNCKLHVTAMSSICGIKLI